MFEYDVKERLRLNFRDLYYYMMSKSNKGGQYVLCNSFPKCGTHLLSQILSDIEGVRYWNDIVSVQSLSGVMNSKFHIYSKIKSAPKNSLIRSHLSYDPDLAGFLDDNCQSQFFMCRDPRDVVVSHANWVLNEPRIFLHDYYKNALKDFDACIAASLKGLFIGEEFGMNISNPDMISDYSRWLGWLNNPSVTVIKFEELVGERGGGDENVRLELIEKIYLDLNVSLPRDFEARYSSVSVDPNASHTFRKGRNGGVGGWKNTMNDSHLELFDALGGSELLDMLGYEK